MATKKQNSNYRPRKQVVKDCLEQGAINETEAKLLNKAITRADSSITQGRMFIDLTPYNQMLTDKFKEKVEKGELSEKQQKTLHLIRVANIHKPHLNDSAEVEKSCEEYLKITIEDNVGCSLNGLALALGFTVKQLKDIEIGALRTPAQDIIKSYIQVIATSTEMTIASGGSVGAMFIGKNYFGMQDKTEIVHSEKKVEMTDEELADKYENYDVVDVTSKEK